MLRTVKIRTVVNRATQDSTNLAMITLVALRGIVERSLRRLIVRCVRVVVVRVPAGIVVHRHHRRHRRHRCLVLRRHRIVHADPLAAPSVHHRGVLEVLRAKGDPRTRVSPRSVAIIARRSSSSSLSLNASDAAMDTVRALEAIDPARSYRRAL